VHALPEYQKVVQKVVAIDNKYLLCGWSFKALNYLSLIQFGEHVHIHLTLELLYEVNDIVPCTAQNLYLPICDQPFFECVLASNNGFYIVTLHRQVFTSMGEAASQKEFYTTITRHLKQVKRSQQPTNIRSICEVAHRVYLIGEKTGLLYICNVDEKRANETKSNSLPLPTHFIGNVMH
jgi:hypothetical protein